VCSASFSTPLRRIRRAFRSKRRWLSAPLPALLLLAVATRCDAQRNLQDIPPPDPELELQSFQVAPGFEVNLFASDPQIAKPIQINFDRRGRLWVASSEVYPQIQPGQQANDKVIVLEDADGDGVAERSTVFAQGLLIPTGIEPGDGGVYVVNSTEVLHLSDTDGDGRADRRRVVLSGFGTEDTHHLLHTLRFGPEGLLYMNQSIYIHSHVETPHGVRRMNGGGIWHFRPETMRLETFTLGLVNPWGHHFDRFGQSFATDGAGGDGINYIFPGWVGVTSPGARRVMRGLNPGSPKYCGLEIISGRHMPPSWRGNLITNDFRAHRVCRFVVEEQGSGFTSRQQQDLIKSSHVAFRPIDVKQGPDGALYIADWYNPIIQHGEVDFRDPRRDHVHGRIWRVTARGRPLVKPPKLAEASIDQLLAALRAPEQWTRNRAKRRLKELGSDAVVGPLSAWVKQVAAAEPPEEHALLEALWTYQSLRVIEPELLRQLLAAEDHRVRAAAARVIYHWHARLPDALAWLAVAVEDEHPRVRLEAVRALSRFQNPQACEVAMRALDRPVDENLDFALWRTARDLEPIWLPALKSGELDFDGQTEHLTFALRAIQSPEVVPLLIKSLVDGDLSRQQTEGIVATAVALGSPQQLRTLLDLALDESQSQRLRVALIEALASAARSRSARPSGSLGGLARLLDSSEPELAAAGLEAVGAWNVRSLRPRVVKLAGSKTAAVRRPALLALARLGGAENRDLLQRLARQADEPTTRRWAVMALAVLDVQTGAQAAARLLADMAAGDDPGEVVSAVIVRQGGVAAMTGAVDGQQIHPDVARLAIRQVRASGHPQPKLVAALTAAGGLETAARRITGKDLEQFLSDVRTDGDAARGEAIYRRADQACMKCHAIGGAGGQVGPDLSGIGASAQADYLLESLLEPGKKIKENYHSLVVATDDGRIVTGVKVRQADRALLLRDAEDRMVEIPLDSIEGQKEGGSLMPVGLVDRLTRAELVDLVRFMSELGKVGRYAVGPEPVARRWQTLPAARGNFHQLNRKGIAAAGTANPELVWEPAYSRVEGALPLAELPTLDVRGSGPLCYVRCQLEVATAGEVALRVQTDATWDAWLDGAPLQPAEVLKENLASGVQTLTLALKPNSPDDRLRIELAEVDGSPAQVKFVGGK